MQGLAPNLPFVVAWVGVETNLYTAVTHRLHNVTGVFDTWILLTTTQEEHIELLVKRLGIAQDARHLRLRGHSPDASLAFVHIVLRATDVDLHLLCLGRSDGELYFVVARQLRALSHSLRCHLSAANGRQHRGQKKSDCSHIDNKSVILCKITNYFPNSAKFARNLRTFAKK